MITALTNQMETEPCEGHCRDKLTSIKLTERLADSGEDSNHPRTFPRPMSRIHPEERSVIAVSRLILSTTRGAHLVQVDELEAVVVTWTSPPTGLRGVT